MIAMSKEKKFGLYHVDRMVLVDDLLMFVDLEN